MKWRGKLKKELKNKRKEDSIADNRLLNAKTCISVILIHKCNYGYSMKCIKEVQRKGGRKRSNICGTDMDNFFRALHSKQFDQVRQMY